MEKLVKTRIIKTRLGKIKGLVTHKTLTFLGIPYASNKRFRPPEIISEWKKTLDATKIQPVPPQRPSRLASVMGDFAIQYDENCLTLNIWAPKINGSKKPVIFWIHGGAFVSGAGSLPWYDGRKFSEDQNVVIVGINYRLGALGFLYHPTLSEGNLGILDQITALKWVKEYIREFGGDTDNVTIMGQSAGAISAYGLLANSESSKLFHKLILQSGRYGNFDTLDNAEQKCLALAKIADVSIEELNTIKIEKLLDAQTDLAKQSKEFASTSIPYLPVVDGVTIPSNLEQEALNGAKGKFVLIGYTHDEMHAFLAGQDEISNASTKQVENVFKRDFGNKWEEKLKKIMQRIPGGNPLEILSLGLNDSNFAGYTKKFSGELAKLGIPTWLYRVDWHPPESTFRACHCIELPFVFNNFDKWLPPMVSGGKIKEMESLSEVVQFTWATFARTGNPNNQILVDWPQYNQSSRKKLILDKYIEVSG